MKLCITLTLSIFLLILFGVCGCQLEPSSATETPPVTKIAGTVPQAEPVQPQDTSKLSFEAELSGDNNDMPAITIAVGSSAFSAKLYNSDTAAAFLARLPMTLNMSELNGNEKYFYLTNSLPADSQRVGNINAGDLMLYGSDCLVLFYKSFTTTYNYTKLGYIEDVSGLADALGRGSLDVSFAVSD